jgi:hypothetical protein
MARSDAATQQPSKTSVFAKNKPVEKFREGPVHVSIWENQGVNGAFRIASFEIRFRKNNEWRSASGYGTTDLAYLEIAAKLARNRIERWNRSRRGGPAQASK